VVPATCQKDQRRDGHLIREMHGAPVKNRVVPEDALRPHRKAALRPA